MSVNLVVNGTTYSFPELSDKDWGLNVTAWATAVTAGMLQKAGGTFTLTADADFGANYGLKSIYYKSRSSNIADAGQVRLARADKISWRNTANGANLDLEVNASDKLLFGGSQIPITSAEITAKVITGFVSGAGTVADTDTILEAINKLDGNVALKLATASFTDAAVTGKLITGFTSGSGTVAGTDTILEAIQKLDGNIADISSAAFHETPSVTMVWKDVDTITVKAGYYFCGDTWIELAADTDWSWTLDTGARGGSAWYYLYAYKNGAAVGLVASLTAPTGKYNTDLSGSTYDSNVYLGAFYDSDPPVGDNSIVKFVMTGNKFLHNETTSSVTHTGSSSFTEKALFIPLSASMACGRMETSETGYTAYASGDGIGYIGYIGTAGVNVYVEVPTHVASTSNYIYLKISNSTKTVSWVTEGWVDKWI